MSVVRSAKFQIGQVVRHRVYPFRGVIFDIDPSFSNTEEWYRSIPQEVRPAKDQPFYHLLAENADSEYIAYVSEQNLVPDISDEPLRHPQVSELFEDLRDEISASASSRSIERGPASASLRQMKRPRFRRGLCVESGLRLTYCGGAAGAIFGGATVALGAGAPPSA